MACRLAPQEVLTRRLAACLAAVAACVAEEGEGNMLAMICLPVFIVFTIKLCVVAFCTLRFCHVGVNKPLFSNALIPSKAFNHIRLVASIIFQATWNSLTLC